ncbi:hypothetical protein HUK65_14380 [Rhodobacteraceae bacterium 2376]|uniref:3-deoxy-D-manno-octulosonic acid transferase n=1 Tax=Rhabdonatronobacter sediminivivens TaxID=2743469 RepID=A0A7Z0I1H4_9RHOB|nr:hypothetical protein [Rhabdonatronobacter sediminivivens]NYS26178.1 hypothetical protein [Rhabdonatronobacter sediminivivens]
MRPAARQPLSASREAAGRPDGRAVDVWIIAQEPHLAVSAHELALRLARDRPDIRAALSVPGSGPPLPGLPDGLCDWPLPPAPPTAIARALEELAPAVLVILGGPVLAEAIDPARARGCAVILAAMGAPEIPNRWRLWPGKSRRLLRKIDRLMITERRDLVAWRTLGAEDARLEHLGPMSPGHGALPCNEAEREALSSQLRLRPVWLAIGVPEGEEDLVLKAHGEALRLSHRLLLLLHLQDPARGAQLRQRVGAHFSVALRSADDPVTEDTQVHIADTEGERGLWYRLANSCFMGGSLSEQGSTLDPMEPAALGAAVLHGPNPGAFGHAYGLLRPQGATLPVTAPDDLGGAVSTALDPQRSATLAQAAWQVISDCAGATDRVTDAILTLLDRAEAS